MEYLCTKEGIATNSERNEETGDLSVCRGCLSTGRRMARGDYSKMYFELTHIAILDAECWALCWECAALLARATHTRRRLLRGHQLLADYATRCAPFPMDASDKELLGLSSPALCSTAMLVFNSEVRRGRGGFYATLTHEKVYRGVLDVQLQKEELKAEPELSDYEDHMTLDEFKRELNVADSCEVSLGATALEGESKVKLEHTVPPVKRKKKRREKGDRSEKERRKRLKPKKERDDYDCEAPARATRVRKAVEVDPDKIRIVHLDPVQQMRAAASSPSLLKFPFRCELCHRGFNYEAKLHNHMKKHDPARGKLECKLCSMYLPTIYSYKVHMITHTTRYECLRCGKMMTDKGCIVEHYEAVHEGKVQQISCRLCGKISSNSKTHRGHMRNHHSGDRPSCDQCGKTFVNKDSLAEHILIHDGIKNHTCDTCAARFRTKTQLKHHQLRHTSEREFYCVECDVRFKSVHNLRQHLSKSLRHRSADSLQFPCLRCPRRLESAKALEHHVLFGHEGRRLFECGECGTRLATRGSLAKHTRVAHRGYRAPLKHVCDACGRAFRGRGVLLNHMRTHTGEKPYECGECGRKFSQRAAMKTHVKLVHLKVKRGTKLRDVEAAAKAQQAPPLPPAPPVQQALVLPKEELLIVYDGWARPATEMYCLQPPGQIGE